MPEQEALFGDSAAVPTGTAVISPDGAYRYRLDRRWDDGPRMVFVMLNPSTANATEDDATIRKCKAFARREGCGSITVVNLYALRSRDPRALLAADEPVGPDNERHIREVFGDPATKLVVGGWGAWPAKLPESTRLPVERWAWDADLTFHALAVTKAGQPGHPLYLSSDAPLVPWPQGT